jgi:hypothetical protein
MYKTNFGGVKPRFQILPVPGTANMPKILKYRKINYESSDNGEKLPLATTNTKLRSQQ